MIWEDGQKFASFGNEGALIHGELTFYRHWIVLLCEISNHLDLLPMPPKDASRGVQQQDQGQRRTCIFLVHHTHLAF